MKFLFTLLLFPFWLFTFLLGKDPAGPKVIPLSSQHLGSILDGAKEEESPNTSFEELQQLKAELGFPWLLAYLPIKSCHVTLKAKAGTFSPPTLSRIPANNWCNWTIWAGPHKHILIYIDGFEGKSDCEENQDKIIFQGVLSSVECKVVSACRNYGTLIFAAQALAVHVVFLSKASFQSHSHKYFKGRYYIFKDYETSTNSEEPVLKISRSTEFPPKSYIMHSGHILDFIKANRKLSNEKSLAVTSKNSWWKKSSAASLEGVLIPAFGNYTQVSLLKPSEGAALNPLDGMRLQLVKPSVDDSRVESATPSGNLTKTLGLELNSMGKEELTLMYKPVVPPTSPHVSQMFRRTAKLAAVKDHGIATKAANFPEDIHLTTHWKPAHVRHTGRSVSESAAFKGSITSPQNSMEEWTAPIQTPKNIPVKNQGYVLESLQSNTGFSGKLVDVMETQQFLKLKEAPTIKEMDNHAHREQNANSDQYMVTTNMGKNEFHGTKLFTQMPKYTIKTKSHLTTLGYHNVLHGPPLRAPSTNLVDTPTTLNPEVVLSSTQVEVVVTSRAKDLITKYKEYPQKKHMTLHPSHSSARVSSNETSLKGKYNSKEMDSAFRSRENYSILEYKPNPGDLLFEITFGIEHKGQIPPIGSDQEKALIDSVKNQVQEKVRHFAGKVKEVRLKGIVKRKGTEMDRQNGPNLLFVFWLHLTLEEKNISQLLPSQLENIGGAPAGTGEVQTVLVKDVNECSSGIGVCGKEAICVNGYGTYTCQCKQDYEDHSLTKSGTLCIRNPRSGLGSLYSYTEILVGTVVFFISALVILISVLCTIVRKRRSKKDVHFQEAATPGTPAVSRLQPTTFDSNNISPLLTLDPAQLKLRAKLPEWPLQLRSSPSETYTVSVEQSENL